MERRLLVVSNRLPVAITPAAGTLAAGTSAAGTSAADPSAAGTSAADPSAAGTSAADPSAAGTSAAGGLALAPGKGGLVRVLDPILRERGGTWVGWPGCELRHRHVYEPMLEVESRARGYRIVPVSLEAELAHRHYERLANGVLWPAFHNLERMGPIDSRDWHAYVAANARFADAVESVASPQRGRRAARRLDELGALVWIHDYQLALVGAELRRRDPTRLLGFFLHIPFPPLESFVKIPWRSELLQGLLAHDLVGFQTERDRVTFLDTVLRLLPHVRVARGRAGERALVELVHGGRSTWVGAFPVGIDVGRVEATASSGDVLRRVKSLREELGEVEVLLGVDRLDYTKGIPERLLAFGRLLEQNPELREHVVLVQLCEPSRENAPQYKELRARVEGLVSAINGQYATPSWVPVHYLRRSYDLTELAALYRLARVCLVTPLRDGMNHVAKEYCAARVDGSGVLVLGELAGAAAQLHDDALVVNPYDIDGTAHALLRALLMEEPRVRQRMRALRQSVAREDVRWWAHRFLEAAALGRARIAPVDAFLPELESQREAP